MPARRKPPGTRQDNRPQRQRGGLSVVRDDGASVTVPPCPKGLLDSSKRRWEEFWSSPIVQAMEPIDVELAEQWIESRDAWRRAFNAAKRKPIVEGSTGQPAANPLWGVLKAREDAMRKLEVQLGIGVENRAKLGVAAGQAKLTAAQLNRMTREPDGEGEGEGKGVVVDVEGQEILDEFEAAE